MIDTTVIIGLLILLTFSSVSSPFVSTEQSEFFGEWYDVRNELDRIDNMLLECKALNEKPSLVVEKIQEILVKQNRENDTRKGDGVFQQGSASSGSVIDFNEVHAKLTDKCAELIIDKFEVEEKLEVLNKWGQNFAYLENKTKTYYVESQYSKNLASGPFTVNMVNLGMIFPFLISVILDTVINNRKKPEPKKEDKDLASKAGVAFMVAGFAAVIIGLTVIAVEFYKASEPFLNF